MTSPKTGQENSGQESTSEEKAQILSAHEASKTSMQTALPATSLPGQSVSLSERAAAEVKRIIAEEGLPASTCLRIGAKGGGCSGFSYVLDFDKKGRTEFDSAYESYGVTVLIDKKSEFVMGGTLVDFNGELLNRGFTFVNPSASGTCGCGTSFTV